VLWGLIIIALVIFLKVRAEETTTGQWLRLATYDLLQQQLAAGGTAAPAVTVLDLSALPGPESGEAVTPRPALQRLVDAVARHRPRAIGVDIDFSLPGEREKPSTQDRASLTTAFSSGAWACRFTSASSGARQGRRIGGWETSATGDWPQPIAVAKERRPSEGELPATTSGDGGETGGAEQGVRSVPLWIRAEEAGATCPSLAAALAGRRPEGEGAAPGLRWLVEGYADLEVKGAFASRDVLVDYSDLDRLETGAVHDLDLGALRDRGDAFTGKVVLLGDLSGGDNLVVPARRRPVPGVLVHACAVETLLGRRPLLQLTEVGRIVMDGASRCW